MMFSLSSVGGSISARTPATVVELSLVPILIDAFMNDNE